MKNLAKLTLLAFTTLIIGFVVSCTKDENLLENESVIENQQQVGENESVIEDRAAPAITTIGGASYSPYFSNGKWSGNTNGPGNYFGFYVVNTYEPSNNNNYWLINGSGFGTATGTILSSVSGLTFTVISWTNTQIKVRPISTYQLDYKLNVVLSVKTVGNQTSSKTINVLGMIAIGRGYGQCTWEVAYQRKLAGKAIPTPSAYTTSGNINTSYVPKQYDVINWNGHTAIILSVPTSVTSNGVTTYTFSLRERNHLLNETATTTTKTFKKSSTQVTQGIKSAASTLGFASTYFR